MGEKNYIYLLSLDVDTSFMPVSSTDLDGSISSPKSMSYSLVKEKELFVFLETSFGGAFTGEGGRSKQRLDVFTPNLPDLTLISRDTLMWKERLKDELQE